MVFMLLDASGFSTRLRMGLPPDNPVLAQVGKFTGDIRQYVWISTWINLLIGIINTVFLLILGVEFALLWGLLSFILGYIQGIGLWLALIPPFLLALLEFGWGKALLVLAGYVVINALIRNLVQPRFMGKGLDLSPLVVILSLFFWGWVLGPVGVLLSIPLTMMVKDIILESGDEARWLADLMGQGEVPNRKSVHNA
jgi:predicted PurR-regulated permease PerM